MGKTAFMFPGQGAQYIGMGRDFFEKYNVARECLQKASEITNLDINHLILEDNAEINITEYTQIALFVTEMAMYKVVSSKNIHSDVNIGLSLGEYSALTASGVLSFEDACMIVRKRGIYMDSEVPKGQGTMAAVLGLSAETVEKYVNKCEKENKKVYAANYNCPGQIVISGLREDVLGSFDELKSLGARRVMELNVSGPFHSGLLRNAGDKLYKEFENVKFNLPQIPYIANVNADYVTEKTGTDNIKDMLRKQVYSSVKFEQSVRKLLNDGVDTFIEIGPGNTLAGFVKKTAKELSLLSEIIIINIESVENLDDLIS